MNEKDFSKAVLNEIQEKEVKPKPKWAFFLHEWLLWFLGAVSVLIGGLSLSIVFVQLRLLDWDLLDIVGSEGVFMALPYLWFVLLVSFIVLAHYQIKHTNKGYKVSVPLLVFLLVSLSLLFGSIFYHFKLGYRLHRHLSQQSDLYERFIDRKEGLWTNPEDGRLGGTLLEEISDDQQII